MIKRCLIIFIALSLSGCAYKSNREIMNSWMGSHISAVIQSWGPPTQITVDGAGGHIYIWRPQPLAPPPATIQKRGVVRWNPLLNQYEYVEETSPTQTLNQTLQSIAVDIHNSSYKMFYVRPNGIIYYWRAQ